jgi:hypothetical protein
MQLPLRQLSNMRIHENINITGAIMDNYEVNAVCYLRLLKQCELEVRTSGLYAYQQKILLEQINYNIAAFLDECNKIDQYNIAEMEEVYKMLKTLCDNSRSE